MYVPKYSFTAEYVIAVHHRGYQTKANMSEYIILFNRLRYLRAHDNQV